MAWFVEKKVLCAIDLTALLFTNAKLGTRTYPTCVHVTRGNARMHEKEVNTTHGTTMGL